jgi:hypothetical protein
MQINTFLYKRMINFLFKKKPYLLKYLHYLKNLDYFTLYDLYKKYPDVLTDKMYLQVIYQNIFHKTLDLKNPQTFNEKIQWLKLYDRNPEYIKMVDKVLVKDYVAKIIGAEYIIPTIKVYQDVNDIIWENLPNQFVLKCTHDSGSTIICRDKKKFDFNTAKKNLNLFLDRNYYEVWREWPYKNINPRILAEEYLHDENEKEIIDYKLMCFNGVVNCSFVCLNRRKKEGLNVDIYDRDWNKMPFERHYHPNSNKFLKKPVNYEKMIQFAEKLSKTISFLRVDFYEIKQKLYFGELTLYPGSGFEEFIPEEWDYILGKWLKLPKKKGRILK